MAKDYSAIHASQGDAIALEQKFFLKEETVRGTTAVPTGADFLFTLSGGALNFVQPVESSPHRTGRHHTSVIKQKTETTWTIPSYFNIDTTLGSAGTGEIDTAFRLLMKSLLGKEDVTGGSPVYTSGNDPDTTFTIFEVGDMWSVQAPGAFVESGNASFPGDGDSQIEFSGNAKTAVTVGIGRSDTDNNGGNTITVGTDEGQRFPVGSYVMLIEADGTTRSADTPDGSPRLVTSVTGDVVTVDGAVLADADGAASEVYLVYYEPETITSGINDPQTGLQGDLTIVGFSTITNCVRSATINMVNNHEIRNDCFGEEGLSQPLFVAGGRFTAEVTLELNLNKALVGFLNKIRDFQGENITLILGDSSSRHMQISCPKAIFPVPEISVPDTGSIPISFTGNAYQTGLDLADEVTISFL